LCSSCATLAIVQGSGLRVAGEDYAFAARHRAAHACGQGRAKCTRLAIARSYSSAAEEHDSASWTAEALVRVGDRRTAGRFWRFASEWPVVLVRRRRATRPYSPRGRAARRQARDRLVTSLGALLNDVPCAAGRHAHRRGASLILDVVQLVQRALSRPAMPPSPRVQRAPRSHKPTLALARNRNAPQAAHSCWRRTRDVVREQLKRVLRRRIRGGSCKRRAPPPPRRPAPPEIAKRDSLGFDLVATDV